MKEKSVKLLLFWVACLALILLCGWANSVLSWYPPARTDITVVCWILLYALYFVVYKEDDVC